MRNKIVFTLAILVIIVVCVVGIGKAINSNDESEEAKPVSDENVSQLRYTVTKDYIENTIQIKGTVVNHNSDVYVGVHGEYYTGSKYEVYYKVYDDVKKDDVLFKIGTTQYKSPVNGKVAEISLDNNSILISIIDYDLLYIDAEINYKYLDKMSIGDKVSVRESNPISENEEFEENIIGYGFEVKDNLIGIYLSNSKNFLPGTQFDIEYKYINEVETCYILKSMLLQDMNGYYVYVEENGERKKRVVTPGAVFTSLNGDIEVEFIEITSGLSEGEKLVTDVIGWSVWIKWF